MKHFDWFKEEMEAVPGDAIRFFARYGGASPLHEGFSLGVTKEQPDERLSKQNMTVHFTTSRAVISGIFVEHDLHVNVDPELR